LLKPPIVLAETDTRERVNARRCDEQNYEVLLADALWRPARKYNVRYEKLGGICLYYL